ncbi:MAG: hypothetical protein WCI22_13350, partial [Actinomycetota bacterium]
MTDDQWRRRREEDDDFGPPLFSDEPTSEHITEALSFTDGETGPLPHWTEPATGEVPRVLAPKSDETGDLDVWSSFKDQGPAWRDDRAGADSSGGLNDITGLSPVFEPEPDHPLFDDADSTSRDESIPVAREPGRITIGTDPTDGASSRPASPNRRPRPGDPTGRGPRPGAPSARGTRARGNRQVGRSAGKGQTLRPPSAAQVSSIAVVTDLGRSSAYPRPRSQV